MEQPAERDVVVARTMSQQQCAELALVLTASGIEHRSVATTRGEWLLLVAAAAAAQAAAELEAYRSEHVRAGPAPPPMREFGGAWLGVGAYAAVLMLIAVLARQYAFGLEWLAAGRLDAGDVRGGEWWRVVTALTLHADTGHLAGNLGFGGFFGYFLGRYFGPGVAWLAILAAGGLGNLLNAWLQSGDHRSIGASTAVFAALGLLTAHAWRRGLAHTSWRARVAPIAAGVGLLAFTGTAGENTDIFAHLTGFVAGFGIGAWLSRVALARSRVLQTACAAAAALVLTLAWLVGLASAG